MLVLEPDELLFFLEVVMNDDDSAGWINDLWFRQIVSIVSGGLKFFYFITPDNCWHEKYEGRKDSSYEQAAREIGEWLESDS